ncbi:pilus assembly protein FimV [Candidatus Vecturithrix granuli]|uniref:Pilus assembly protein FimV n=1 Tax=Vecturithrix granuli TaxID=1499967 RepID=A0A081C1I0_VECG1|nr:pilus assembly protein FimV [Candidatus Vecturithrix granuli]
MKKMCVSLVVFCLLTVIFCLQPYEQTCSAETLKVIQDQFEFRDEPRVADETILGTLRLGTPVEWTGEASGDWLRVKAPNGQMGWVHSSGLSKPTTPVQPIPTPRSQTSRSISAPAASDQTKLETTIRKLEQTNKQYQGTLAEKDRRIAELTKDIEALEAKLTDVAQMIDDQGQLHKVDQIKATELQNEIVALQDAIKKKDEALLTEKVERTKLSNHLNELQIRSGIQSSQERFWLYAISLPLNLLAFLVIGLWGIRRLRRQKPEDAMLESLISEREDTETMMSAQKQEVQEEPESTLPSQQEKVGKQGVEKELEELDIVMAASSKAESSVKLEPEATTEEPVRDEEVVIDLADVLPTDQGIFLMSEKEEEIEIVITDLEPEEPEAILSEQAIATIEEKRQSERQDETFEFEEPASAVEIFPQEIADESVVMEESDQVMIVETDEVLTPLDESLDDHIEALLENVPPIPQDTSLEELLEEGELEELEEEARSETEASAEALESEIPEEVEIEGEKFEMLVERNTQIIELTEEEKFEEEQISEIAIVAEEAAQNLHAQLVTRKAEVPEKVATFDEMIMTSAESDEETFESSDVEVAPDFEPELTPVEQSAPEKFLESVELEDQKLLEQIPAFLEPTPFLIEPEHEPEEPSAGQETESAVSAEHAKESRYDIELVDVGKNLGHIIHILSKIEGLTKSPQELVEHVPCIIARGAKETDAKNFQVVMQKFGSEVSLIKR